MSDPATPIELDESGRVTFETFYRSSWPDAVRWACALSGSIAAGEDIAQIAFTRIAARYDDVDNPAGYLRTTIVNLARSDQRTSSRRSAREWRVVTDRNVGHEPEPFVDGSELLRLVGTLPYDQRAAIVLRYWADWDEVAIAHALGCRPATVRSHAKRGLDSLRRTIGTSTPREMEND